MGCGKSKVAPPAQAPRKQPSSELKRSKSDDSSDRERQLEDEKQRLAAEEAEARRLQLEREEHERVVAEREAREAIRLEEERIEMERKVELEKERRAHEQALIEKRLEEEAEKIRQKQEALEEEWKREKEALARQIEENEARFRREEEELAHQRNLVAAEVNNRELEYQKLLEAQKKVRDETAETRELIEKAKDEQLRIEEERRRLIAETKADLIAHEDRVATYDDQLEAVEAEIHRLANNNPFRACAR
eukprot:Selendium_serpulae@DN3525_c0_g1_i1.p1